METFRLIEGLKDSIQSDIRDYEQKCNKANEKILSLEKENGQLKEQANRFQADIVSLKENSSMLEKELAYRDERLRRKTEELHRKERWWSKYRKMCESRFRAMKKYGTFPSHILEKFINKDMNELMSEVAEEACAVKENELRKRNSKLSTIKSKKKVRYNTLSFSQSNVGEESKKQADLTDSHPVNRTSERQEETLAERIDLRSGVNDSTMLYNTPARMSKTREKSVPPEILVPETEFDGLSEVAGDEMQYSIGVPSAASTPVAAANSPLFREDDEDVDDDDDDDDDDGGGGGSFEERQAQSHSHATAIQFVHTTKALPSSDSQLPVDLSYTQPPSPTIPSRSRSLQQDLSSTLDCSVSLLPHGMNGEDQGTRHDLKETTNVKHKTVSPDSNSNAKTCRPKEGTGMGGKKKNKTLKQTMIDSDIGRTLAAPLKDKDIVGKRKRERSDEVEEISFRDKKIESENADQTSAVFKVPSVPPPMTPEVVLLDFTSCRRTEKHSPSSLLSGSSESPKLFTSGVDLFDEVEEHHSPACQEAKKDGLQESSGKETTVKEKNNKFISGDAYVEDNCPVVNRNPAPEAGYKYVEVVRKRDARAKLNGYPCRECQEYYEGLDLPQEELQKRMKHCSRHRAKFSPPPSTPPGFWNLSFPNTQEYMDKGYLKTDSQAPATKRPRRMRRHKMGPKN